MQRQFLKEKEFNIAGLLASIEWQLSYYKMTLTDEQFTTLAARLENLLRALKKTRRARKAFGSTSTPVPAKDT
jgi:hypothetical protein